MAALTIVLLLVMVTEAAPVDENQELLERIARSALDDPSKRDALNDLFYEYLLELQQQQEAEDPIYAKKRLSGLPGLDSLSMISKARHGKGFKVLGRRRRSLYDLE